MSRVDLSKNLQDRKTASLPFALKHVCCTCLPHSKDGVSQRPKCLCWCTLEIGAPFKIKGGDKLLQTLDFMKIMSLLFSALKRTLHLSVQCQIFNKSQFNMSTVSSGYTGSNKCHQVHWHRVRCLLTVHGGEDWGVEEGCWRHNFGWYKKFRPSRIPDLLIQKIQVILVDSPGGASAEGENLAALLLQRYKNIERFANAVKCHS